MAGTSNAQGDACSRLDAELTAACGTVGDLSLRAYSDTPLRTTTSAQIMIFEDLDEMSDKIRPDTSCESRCGGSESWSPSKVQHNYG